jgi:glucose-6-phosphate-specific signal transduction histidine kinase
MTPVEEKLLLDLASQAGLVLKNVGLTDELLQRLEDLRASRQRLVAAQDDERRRLERNLHDGAQQNLVTMKVKLGLAEMLADKDMDKSRALLSELQADADEALERRDQRILPPSCLNSSRRQAQPSVLALTPVTGPAWARGSFPARLPVLNQPHPGLVRLPFGQRLRRVASAAHG